MAYIALNSISTFLRHFYPEDLVPSSSSSSLLSSFNNCSKLLHCRNGPGCCSSCGISSLTTVPDGIFFPLPLLLFCCNKFTSVLFIEAFCTFLENCSRYYPQSFFSIQWVIVVKMITVKGQ